MIAKIIVHASHRHEVIHKLDRVLQSLWCEGITCNKDFLSKLLNTPEVLYGNFSTHFVEKEFCYKTFKDLEEKEQKKIIAYFAICYYKRQQKTFYFELVFLSENITFTFYFENYLSFNFSKPFIQKRRTVIYYMLKNSFSHPIGYKGIVTKYKITPSYFYKNLTYFKEDFVSYESNIIKAYTRYLGQIVAIIETMKMENAIKAPLDAIVQEIYLKLETLSQRMSQLCAF